MKFPLSKIDVKDYHDKIYELIEDDACNIFIDTNIIALFYGIHDSARKEFFEWLKKLIQKERVKVPVWVINEYTNRFIRNKIQDYLSPLKKVSTIKKDFEQVSAFLKMHIEESNLPQNKYSSIDDFQNDLRVIEEKIEKIAFTAKNKDEKYKLKIHDEIKQILETCIIDTDIDKILNKIDALGLVRYYHKLPPGFQDDTKDMNAYGDLILWYEILEHCKNKGIKKAILITNDEKNDWVYAPNKLIIHSKEISNTNSRLKIVDPRLIQEFKTFTESEDFYIISFELLTQILIENISNNFTNLASALQLVHSQSSEENENGEDSTNTVCNEDADHDLITNENEQQDEKHIEIINQEIKKDVDELEFSVYALADRDFPLMDNTFLTQVIDRLKSHNWYIQNPAIDEFLKFDSKLIEESKSNSDKLFVLGRNIYQSACGGSKSAIDFIKNLRYQFNKLNDYIINHLYSGILYEIYFNSENIFRGNKLKSYYINEVINLIDTPRLKPSINFIKSILTSYENKLLFIPYKAKKVLIEPTFNENTIEEEDWLVGKTHYLQLDSLKCNGKEMLTDNPNESLDIYFLNPKWLGLIDLICETYAIPSTQIEIKANKQIDENLNIKLGGKKLATIKCISDAGKNAE